MSGIGSSGNGSEQRRAMVDRALTSMPVPKATAAMTSQERSEQADLMRTQLVELTRAHNRLVELVDGIHSFARMVNEKTEAAHIEIASLKTQQGATFSSLAEFCGRPFWQRLRWLVTGR